MPSSACGTCKVRRLRCDRKLPACSNCLRAHRTCEGYGLRLSWPKQHDRKRSLVGPAPIAGSRHRVIHTSYSRWINTSFHDIDTYLHLSGGLFLPGLQDSGGIHSPPSLPPKLSWTPTRLHVSHITLIQYFQLIASKVITCDDHHQTLLGIVTRLSFRDASVSSQAVLLSTLAVSSLFLYGLSTETVKLQGKAICALQNSLRRGGSASEAAQNIAAEMLLCCFESHGSSQTSEPWFRYIDSAKEMIRAADLRKDIVSGEFVQVAGWVYHHDIIAQFSLRHWRRDEQMREKISPNSETPPVDKTAKSLTSIIRNMSEMAAVSMPAQIILWSMADIFQNILDDSDPRYEDVKYRNDIILLEHRLESILNGSQVRESERPNFDQLETSGTRQLAVLELYRLATLIYLERASRNFSGTSTKLSGWADAAFKLIKRMGCCKQVFPVLIVAYEARTDEKRIIILDWIQKTAEATPSRGLHLAEEMIHRAWNLDDLETGGDVKYMAKLDAITSHYETMPSFA
ncbi:fungal-specific transcription factor domain-containing protein [Xylariales sp. PMI_506]|nr:fungal-specific transcription factor domain-containing protein [Xylariales sp. PMI_506]